MSRINPENVQPLAKVDFDLKRVDGGVGLRFGDVKAVYYPKEDKWMKEDGDGGKIVLEDLPEEMQAISQRYRQQKPKQMMRSGKAK